jgi:hypothetical protein
MPVKTDVESILVKIERVIINPETGTSRVLIDFLPWNEEEMEEPMVGPAEDPDV